MAISLIPAGQPIGIGIGSEAIVIVSKVWRPHAPPKAIGPGELDAITTTIDRIYWQWQQGPNIQALATIIGTISQTLVAEQLEVARYRYLATGFGQILDELAAFVGLERRGLADEVFRGVIRIRGASMFGEGGIDSVMTPVKRLLGADAVSYLPTYPAAFQWVISLSLSSEQIDLLLELLPPLVPSGVGAALLLAPLESPGWDSTTPQVWAASWASSVGDVDGNVASAWTLAVQVGVG